jgi:hypothetical protein
LSIAKRLQLCSQIKAGPQLKTNQPSKNMTKRSFKQAFLAVSLTAATMLAQPAFATNYTDTTGDTFPGVGGGGILDIVSVEVNNSISDLIFTVTLGADVVVTDWGKYMIAIDTTVGGDAAGNGWGRPISMSQGMDYWVGTWVDSGNGAELRNWDGAAWQLQLATYNPPAQGLAVSKSGSTVTITVPFAQMGLSIGNSFEFDLVSSGGGGGDGAIDSLANPSQSVANWGDAYDCSTGDLPKIYTLVQPPDPTNRVTFLLDMQVPIALFDADFTSPEGFDTNSDAVYVRGNYGVSNALIQVGSTLFSNTVDVVAPSGATFTYKFYGAPFPSVNGGEEYVNLSCNANRTLQITSMNMSAPLAYWSDRKLTDPNVQVT